MEGSVGSSVTNDDTIENRMSFQTKVPRRVSCQPISTKPSLYVIRHRFRWGDNDAAKPRFLANSTIARGNLKIPAVPFRIGHSQPLPVHLDGVPGDRRHGHQSRREEKTRTEVSLRARPPAELFDFGMQTVQDP